MSNENQPKFGQDLAQAAQPTEVDVEQIESHNNPADSLRIGLVKLYYNYSQEIANRLKNGLIDGDKAKELTAQINELSLADLDYDISESIPLEIAKLIMGKESFFGPKEVKNAFGIEITEQIPPIPFSPKELDRAKALGQFLVLRINQTADGQPLTMEKIDQLMQPEFDREGKGEVLWMQDWYKSKGFFTSQTPTMGWALTARQTIPDSKEKNYLEQTEVLVDYLKTKVFAETRLPIEYSNAITEFEASKDEIMRLMDSDWLVASQKLSELRINQLTRQSAVEVIYDELIYFQNTNEWILDSEYTWTNTCVFGGDGLVLVGFIDSAGAVVSGRTPDHSSDSYGASFSRRGADLKS